jgi:hypothetical protein
MRLAVVLSLTLALAGVVAAGPAWSQAAPPPGSTPVAVPTGGGAAPPAASKSAPDGDFEALRSRRATIVARLPALQDELKELDEKLKSLRSTESLLSERSGSDTEQYLNFLADRQSSIEEAIADTKRRLEEARGRTPANEVELRNIINLLQAQESELRRVESDRKRAEQRKEAEDKQQAQIQDQLRTVRAEIAVLDGRVTERKKEIAELSREQSEVENRINLLLIPQNQENQFKLWITGAFTVLVGLVIVGFFIVAVADEKVRQAIFSSQSGIQFLTLFSLVIAIILFGITKILEGKELAALLGGLSGYILGRVGKD